MPKFNHAFDFAFEVVSEKEDASDVTHEMLLSACLERLSRLAMNSQQDPSKENMLDACGCYTTYEIEENDA